MRYDIPATATTAAQITQSVNQCLGRLLQKRQLDEAAHDDFAAVRDRLEAMCKRSEANRAAINSKSLPPQDSQAKQIHERRRAAIRGLRL